MYPNGSFLPLSRFITFFIKKASQWVSKNDSDILALTRVSTLVKFQKLFEVGELIVFRLNYNTSISLGRLLPFIININYFKLNITYKCLCGFLVHMYIIYFVYLKVRT